MSPVKAITDTIRGWASVLRRNPRREPAVRMPVPLTLEQAQENLVHHAPCMNRWGRHIRFSQFAPDDLDRRRIYGHYPRRLTIGERFAYDMQSGRTAIFEIVEIEYLHDPEDMFFGYAVAVGWVEEAPECLCLPNAPSPSDPSMLRSTL